MGLYLWIRIRRLKVCIFGVGRCPLKDHDFHPAILATVVPCIVRGQGSGGPERDAARQAGVEGGRREKNGQDIDRSGPRQGPVVPVAAVHRKVVGMSLDPDGPVVCGQQSRDLREHGAGLPPDPCVALPEQESGLDPDPDIPGGFNHVHFSGRRGFLP